MKLCLELHHIKSIKSRRLQRGSKMSKNQFDWDGYIRNASYSMIYNYSPALISMGRLPTIYSPDRKLLYLSSQDNHVETDNIKALESILCKLTEAYQSAIKKKDYKKMWLIKIDGREVSNLLSNFNGIESGNDTQFFITDVE